MLHQFILLDQTLQICAGSPCVKDKLPHISSLYEWEVVVANVFEIVSRFGV